MLKFFCVFVISLAAGYERAAEIPFGHIYKIKNDPGLSVKAIRGGKTEFTWNEPVDTEINPLRATFAFRYTRDQETYYANFTNLCGSYVKGTFEHRVQIFILKTVANVDHCPIKKGAKAILRIPSTYNFSTIVNLKCGPYKSKLKLFRKNDTDNSQPIILGKFRGNLTGCS